jgi:glutamyl-tRNA reductase
MTITLVGVNHRTAPIEVRERLAWPEAEVPGVLRALLGRGGSGAVVLSTCNRVEFYIADADGATLGEVWRLGAGRLGSPLEPYSYLLQEDDAVRHLFRVVSGLDSMVLGESQIQGQVRQAWDAARGQAGPVLSRLFQLALRVGGRVRSETGLGAGAASVPSASVDLARKIFGQLVDRRALVLGSGEMAELAMSCLASEGVRAAVVAHRNVERATDLAVRLGGRAVAFDDAWDLFGEVDLVICSTAAPHHVVTVDKVRAALARRGGRPLCLLDIAVPRDVHPDVGRLEHVFLYDVDDLQTVVATSVGSRAREIPAAERIVGQEVGTFWEWYGGRGVVDTIKALRGRLDAVRDAELRRALRKLDHLDPGDVQRITHLTRSLMNKFLHVPTVRLRGAAGNGAAQDLAHALEYLFDLEVSDPSGGKDDE